jgi:hypothetical protein
LEIVLYIFLLIACGFVALVIGMQHHADKLLFGLPWLRWITLDEAVQMGHSRFWCRFVLPMFYERGYLEIRFSETATELERETAEETGYNPVTVAYYDFKLTKHKGGHKNKWWLRQLKLFPAPAY